MLTAKRVEDVFLWVTAQVCSRQLTCLRPPQRKGRQAAAHRAQRLRRTFAATLSVPRLNRSSRMSDSSLLLARLAWLAFICTSLADADVVAVTTSKCLDTCRTAGDGICQENIGASGSRCEFGTDCTDCGPRLLVDPPQPPSPPQFPPPPPPTPLPPPPPPVAGTVLVPATHYTVSFYVSGTIDQFDWRNWSVVRAGLQSYLQCFEPVCTVEHYFYYLVSLTHVDAVVTDATGNGSSTATVQRAAALCQESKTGLCKAVTVTFEGPVTASAPRSFVMVQVSPLTRPPSTAPPPEPEAKPARPQWDPGSVSWQWPPMPPMPPMWPDSQCGGRRRISSTSSHRRSSQVDCEEEDPDIIVIVAIPFLAIIFTFLMALAACCYRKDRQRGIMMAMQRNAQPQQGISLPSMAVSAVGDAA